jgi:hypothetical protein
MRKKKKLCDGQKQNKKKSKTELQKSNNPAGWFARGAVWVCVCVCVFWVLALW